MACLDHEIAALELDGLKVDGERLPEVQQFERLLQDICQELGPRGSKGLGRRGFSSGLPFYPDLSAPLSRAGPAGDSEIAEVLSGLTCE